MLGSTIGALVDLPKKKALSMTVSGERIMKKMTEVLRYSAVLALLGAGTGLTRFALADGGCAKRPGPHCQYDMCGEGASGCSKICAQGSTSEGIGPCVGGLSEEECNEWYSSPGMVWYYTGQCIDNHCNYNAPVSTPSYNWYSTDTSPCGS